MTVGFVHAVIDDPMPVAFTYSEQSCRIHHISSVQVDEIKAISYRTLSLPEAWRAMLSVVEHSGNRPQADVRIVVAPGAARD